MSLSDPFLVDHFPQSKFQVRLYWAISALHGVSAGSFIVSPCFSLPSILFEYYKFQLIIWSFISANSCCSDFFEFSWKIGILLLLEGV